MQMRLFLILLILQGNFYNLKCQPLSFNVLYNRGVSSSIQALTTSNTGKYIVYSTGGRLTRMNELKIIDFTTNCEILSIPVKNSNFFTFSKDDSLFAYTDLKKIHIIKLPEGKTMNTFSGDAPFSFSPTNEFFCFAGTINNETWRKISNSYSQEEKEAYQNNEATVYSLRSNKVVKKLKTPAKSITALLFDPNYTQVYLAIKMMPYESPSCENKILFFDYSEFSSGLQTFKLNYNAGNGCPRSYHYYKNDILAIDGTNLRFIDLKNQKTICEIDHFPSIPSETSPAGEAHYLDQTRNDLYYVGKNKKEAALFFYKYNLTDGKKDSLRIVNRYEELSCFSIDPLTKQLLWVKRDTGNQMVNNIRITGFATKMDQELKLTSSAQPISYDVRSRLINDSFYFNQHIGKVMTLSQGNFPSGIPKQIIHWRKGNFFLSFPQSSNPLQKYPLWRDPFFEESDIYSSVHQYVYDINRKILVYINMKGEMRIRNLLSNEFLKTPENESSYQNAVCNIIDSILIIKKTDNIIAYDLIGEKIIFNKAVNSEGKTTYVDQNQFFTLNKPGDLQIFYYNGNAVTLNYGIKQVSIKNGKLQREFQLVPPFYFSEKSEMLAGIYYSQNKKYIRVYDINEKKVQAEFEISFESISNIEIRERFLFVYLIDGFIDIYNISDPGKYSRLSLFSGLRQLLVSNNGYYSVSSKELLAQVFYKRNNVIHLFEQFDLKYNRPDKILEIIGSHDSSLIKSLRQAYIKRLKRYDVDNTNISEDYSYPESKLVNRGLIEYEQISEKLILHIYGNSTVSLDRFNIWVNEVPVYGQKGISLRKRLINKLDTTITITLSAGENQIETSVTDINGIESYRQPLYVKYNPEKPVKSNTYFIGIGINRFADNRNNLSWSVKDIRDLSQYFASKGAIIDTLFDERVTRANILNLKQRLAGTAEEDKVIIAYSGHGLLSSDFDYYLSTHTVNFSKPEENGLPYEELESLLDGIRARKKLMLIDACHSGEVDKEEIARYETAIDSLQIKGTRGGKPRVTSGNSLGMKNSFELMQELFVNVGRSTGATVISAAGGTQFAQERGDLKNGVFSFVLLELFRNSKTVSISDLKKTVLKRVPELTNGLQKPTFRSEIQRFDWSL